MNYTSSILRDKNGRILLGASANLMVRRGEAKDYYDACSKIANRKNKPFDHNKVDISHQWLPYSDN